MVSGGLPNNDPHPRALSPPRGCDVRSHAFFEASIPPCTGGGKLSIQVSGLYTVPEGTTAVSYGDRPTAGAFAMITPNDTSPDDNAKPPVCAGSGVLLSKGNSDYGRARAIIQVH